MPGTKSPRCRDHLKREKLFAIGTRGYKERELFRLLTSAKDCVLPSAGDWNSDTYSQFVSLLSVLREEKTETIPGEPLSLL